MNIVIAGSGYVGLVTGACLAELGFTVACADKDAEKIARLNSGIVPIHEPKLDRLIADGIASGRLSYTVSLGEAVGRADVVFITVGTPIDAMGEGADLSAVMEVAREIAAHLRDYTVVVTKSTVPAGTARRLAEFMRSVRPDADFEVISNPEFLREGSAVDDFMMPDRIVVGARGRRAEQAMRALYAPFTERGVPLVMTSNEAAEIIKYSSNTYLAMRIALVNQLADICESVGADIGDVTHGMGLDHRIGPHYLKPGPGFGGSCFPKDARALAATARQAGTPTTLIEAVIEANERRKNLIFERLRRLLGGDTRNKQIAVLGIAFKANTDDIRDSAAAALIPALRDSGALVAVYDPAAQENGTKLFKSVEWHRSAYDAAKGADLAVILTEWPEFKSLDLSRLRDNMNQPVMLDLRNLYDLNEIADAGFNYHSVGRVSIHSASRHEPVRAPDKRQRLPGGTRFPQRVA